MSKSFHATILLLVALAIGSCGGGGASRQVTISWDANRDKVVNAAGGGYIIYYSQESGFDVTGASSTEVPYVSGSTAPTSTTLSLSEGVWYIRISAYGIWNGETRQSEPSTQLMVNVGG